QDNENQNEDYDLDNEIENNTLLDKLDKGSDKILPDEPQYNRIDTKGPNRLLAQLKDTWEVDCNTIEQWNEKLNELGISYATLQLIFQFKLPSNLQTATSIFFSEQSNQLAIGLSKKVIENIKIEYNFDKLKIVILKPDPVLNSNNNAYKTCNMFLNDIANTRVTTIDIACDKAIFQRLKNYDNQNLITNIILGQWYTSKDICQALIAAFSRYRIFNIAAHLGIQYLENLEKRFDYHVTCTVLELIWAAVRIAIHRYLQNTKKTINDIENSSNNILKVWLNYYQYAELVTIFLEKLYKNSQLQKILYQVPSINITCKEYYLVYDEVLETYSVKFVKQVITGRSRNEKNLHRQIQGSQDEIDRLTVFDKFIDQIIDIENHATPNQHKQL
ncbi:11074_t:CDS:2, partial [Dentiscutata heterogama]